MKSPIAKAIAPLFSALFLSACLSTSPQFSGLSDGPALTPQPQNTLQTQGLPPANGQILGTGTIRVAMLVPKSAQGFGALAAENFTNAAALALKEFDENTVNIVVKDTFGTPEGAAKATREALSERAEVILGPVFSKTVPAVLAVARPAGIPVLTFSNSSALQSRGSYVFGFAPEPGISRVIHYAGSQERKSFAALLPNNAFGTLAEAAFRQSVASSGGRIVSILRYNYGTNEPILKAQELATLASNGQIDTIFIPDAGDVAPQLVSTIQAGTPPDASLLFIGSGQWDDPRIFRNPALAGVVYPAPDREGFNTFASRYNANFGKPPIRLASLGYDAASLMVVLAQNFGEERFSDHRLTDASGFKGVVDGTFRLETNGKVKRALAIYEVTTSGPKIVSPAPRSFSEVAFN